MAGRWFQRIVWIGIASNLALAIPTLLSPAASMARAGVPPQRRCCGRSFRACC
jgi:hypothetical protein